MEKATQSCDVCIVCALPKEARAVLHVVEEQCHVTFTERSSPRYQYAYRAAMITNHKDEPLHLHLSWLPRYGPQQMIRHLERVLEEYQPRLVLMTGICAGDAQQVQLGDLVVAERVFTYDNGKFTRDEQGRTVHQHDATTYQLNANLLQYLELFDAWESLVVGLERPSLPSHQFSRSQVRCHIKPMASGSAVRADHPFEDVRVPVRGTVAIDMESAALGLVMSDHPLIPWLVVKGVCDYADSQKDDTYHDFAARASALYALSCIQNYVTNERLPPHLPAETQPKFLSFPKRNRFFTGRETFLQDLHKALYMDQSVILTYASQQAIVGMGGIGKTQAAIEYAYRYRDNYETVFWVKADRPASIRSSFRDIAKQLNLEEKNNKTSQIVVRAVKNWLEGNTTSWLLIFDNADDLEAVQDFLPQAQEKGQHVLLTTRDRAVGAIHATRIEIDPMDENEGMLFLLRRANIRKPTNDDQHYARAITQELRGLPLALEQAGAYIESTGTSFKKYFELFQRDQLEHLKRSKGKAPDYKFTVATTWRISFKRVNETDPAASELLRLCAFLDPDAIPEEIITGGTQTLGPILGPLSSDASRMNDAIGVLFRFSLVQRNVQAEETLTIHRLVQAVIQDDMDEETRRTWAERTIRTLNNAFPKRVDDIRTWPQCQRCLPHAMVCASLIEKYRFILPEAAQLLNQVGYYLREQARYRAAGEYFQQALSISNQSGLDNYLDTIINNLARLYFDTYRYKEAASFYEQALAMREQKLGPEDAAIAGALNRLALTYWYEGNKGEKSKYTQAEALYERALRISTQKLGPEDNETLRILNNQALLYRSLGRYEEAIKLNRHVLEIRERKEPPVPLDVAQSLQNQAVTYYEQGDQSKYEEAEKLLKRALAIREEKLQPKHLQIARCLNYLALVYQIQKKYKEAVPCFKRALDIMEEQLEGDLSETISVARNYHSLLLRLIPELQEDVIRLETRYKMFSLDDDDDVAR